MENRIYKVGELFKVSGSKTINKDIAIKGDGSLEKIPYICRGQSNNGCEGYFNFTPSQKSNCITVGSQGAKAFYQHKDFFTGTGVLILRTEKLTENIALYICTILNKNLKSGGYGYGYEVSQDKLKDIEISLPSIIHEDGTYEPDWNYMENYIANLRKKIDIYTQDSIDIIENVKSHRGEKKIDTSGWKEYNVKDIFDVSGVKSDCKLTNNDVKKYKTNIFNVTSLGATDGNNQVQGYIQTNIYDTNIISVNIFTGKCFYQSGNVVAGSHGIVKIVPKNKKLNENLGLFLIVCFNKKAITYNRQHQRSSAVIKNETISLPSIIHEDGTYEPDWDYMENYIKKLKEKKYDKEN